MLKVLHVVNISFVLPYYIGDQFTFFNNDETKFYVACSHSEHLIDYSVEKKFTPFSIPILRSINPVQDLKSILKLSRLIKKHNINVVFGHTPKGALIGISAAYFCGVKRRVYFRHGLMYETTTGFKRFILKNIERLTGHLATDVVCVSQSVLNKSNFESLNNPKKNILLGKGTCNGLDSNFFSLDTLGELDLNNLRETYKIGIDDRVIGFVGRLVNDKGINELVGAWKILMNAFPNIKLLLVGPFEDRDSLPSSLKTFIENEPTIIYTGLVPNVKQFYGLMDIFILPSYREGFPTVVLEASAMELPVITTRSTGCIDSILENITGVFCDITPQSIAGKIKFYLNDIELAKWHGSCGRKFVMENFRQIKIWEEIEDKILNLP